MARTPAYAARDGLIVGIVWNTSTEALTLAEAADKAVGFTRMAAETASPGLASTAMDLAGDLIAAVQAAKADLANLGGRAAA